MIRNPGDKESSIFNFFLSGGEDNTRWKKVQSGPKLIFLSGNQPIDNSAVFVLKYSRSILQL